MRFVNISTLLALVACTTGEEKVQDISPELRRFESCSEAQDFLSDVMLNTALEYQYGYGWWGVDDIAMEEGAPEASGDSSSSEAPSDYTTTNVQEEGVDELDVVKTDGEYIYVAQDKGLHIVDSWPVEEAIPGNAPQPRCSCRLDAAYANSEAGGSNKFASTHIKPRSNQ